MKADEYKEPPLGAEADPADEADEPDSGDAAPERQLA